MSIVTDVETQASAVIHNIDAAIEQAAESAWTELKTDASAIAKIVKPLAQAAAHEVLNIASTAVLQQFAVVASGQVKFSAAVNTVVQTLAGQGKSALLSFVQTIVQTIYNYYANKATAPAAA